jgi:hypothetical protein
MKCIYSKQTEELVDRMVHLRKCSLDFDHILYIIGSADGFNLISRAIILGALYIQQTSMTEGMNFTHTRDTHMSSGNTVYTSYSLYKQFAPNNVVSLKRWHVYTLIEKKVDSKLYLAL